MPGSRRRSIILWTIGAVLVLPPLADFALWSLWRQELQDSVDHAVEDAAKALRDGRPVVPAALATLRPDRLALARPPAIEHPPEGGRYRGDRNAVRIRVTAVRTPFFLSPLVGPSRMTAESTGAVLPTHRPGGTRAARVE